MEQISFSDAEYSAKKKITRREKLQMEQIVPWAILLREIEPLYPVTGRGRRPYPCASMLRIHLMQHWFALSDPGMEDALYEIESMRHFAGIKLNAVPDETTILNFRRFIEDNDLSIDILDKINQHLARKGLLLKTGTVVDATIIKAPCSTKNKTGGRDPEMHQTKKGNQWYFGMKAHIGVDASSGLVHTVVTTAANEADVSIAEELLHGKEQTVHADAGYTGADKLYRKKGRGWHIAIKRGRLKKMAEGEQKDKLRAEEIAKARIRARVEHPFHTLKCVSGYTKARFKGLAHQPGGAAVCVGQPAQGEGKADGDQRAARVGAVQGRGAPENSVARAKTGPPEIRGVISQNRNNSYRDFRGKSTFKMNATNSSGNPTYSEVPLQLCWHRYGEATSPTKPNIGACLD